MPFCLKYVGKEMVVELVGELMIDRSVSPNELAKLNATAGGWTQVQEVGEVHSEILPAAQVLHDCPVVG